MLSYWLLSRGPVPSKIIWPLSPIAFIYLLKIQHNWTSLICPESSCSFTTECNKL
jgi:hypothetical protein